MPRLRHISIVDDDPSVLRALTRLCRSSGYEVSAFDSAEAFLATDRSGGTDCLVLDVHLPGMDGLELHNLLAGADSLVPVVFITAFESEDAKRSALERGARAFLRKPLDSEHLLEVIREAVG